MNFRNDSIFSKFEDRNLNNTPSSLGSIFDRIGGDRKKEDNSITKAFIGVIVVTLIFVIILCIIFSLSSIDDQDGNSSGKTRKTEIKYCECVQESRECECDC